jgi:peptidoglycan/xylan/chitin deacetylase (PgdA/CDA1 family)
VTEPGDTREAAEAQATEADPYASGAAQAAGPLLPVYLALPERLRPRAEWVLSTLLAACGARLEAVSDAERAQACVLAYAPEPVPGVPTVPFSEEAADLLLADRPIPPNSFQRHVCGDFRLAGAFSRGLLGDADAFAAPFDLVTSAFLMLAAWDERTSPERDRHGRFPYEASLFATQDELSLGEAPVDGYARFLRDLIGRRLAELNRPPLPPLDWGGGPFAIAFTHDVDHMQRWTGRGVAAAARRAGRAAAARDRERARFELEGLRRAALHHLPRGTDPYWTFPQLLAHEASLGIHSTFFVIASHGHPTDGNDPTAYARRRPALLKLLRARGAEVGVHGNERDRRDPTGLRADLDSLLAAAGDPVVGMRYHYLRCLYHETLPLLDEAGFLYDTSLGYAEREGFRNGCSFPFHPYDLDHERPLRLVELPLAIMDSTLQEQHYRGLSAADALPAALAVLERVRAGGGAVSVLWHQNRFDEFLGLGYGDVYWRLVRWAKEHDAACVTAESIMRRWLERQGEAAVSGRGEPAASEGEPVADTGAQTPGQGEQATTDEEPA